MLILVLNSEKFKLPLTSVWRNPKSERNRIRNFFPIPNFFDTESDTFSDTDFFPIPIPILFSIPKFYETDTNTFFDTKIFRNRYRYFFHYQFFSKPIPILFLKPKIFETDTIPTIGIVSKPRSLETEMSHSDTKSLWFHDLALFVRLSMCVFKCFLKLPASEDVKSHWLHLFDFSPLCVFKCLLKLPAQEDV